MANILTIISRVVCILCIIVLSILAWKTRGYFNRIPEKDKPLIGCDWLVILCVEVYLVLKLVTM